MKIAIIGKVNQNLSFEEWISKLQTNVEILTVSHFHITIGKGKLNQFVRQYAQSRGIIVIEYAADYASFGDKAKLNRNLALIGNSDMVVGFQPISLSTESCKFRQGILCEKKAIIINC